MLSLASLAGWEEGVLASVAGAAGTPEERHRQIERSGLYAEYPAILNGYLALVDDAEAGREALKRALFIVWRGATAVPCETAIDSVPEAAVRTTFDALHRRERRGEIDAELAAMLGWYHWTSPPFFELYGLSRTLVDRLVEDEGYGSAPVLPMDPAGRGQLGRYWRALAHGR